MSGKLLAAAGLALAVLHHDWWLWDNSDLVLGIVPMGMAYHMAYTVAVSVFWACVVIWAWPRNAESMEPEGEAAESVKTQ